MEVILFGTLIVAAIVCLITLAFMFVKHGN